MGLNRTTSGIATLLLLVAPLAFAQSLQRKLETNDRGPWSQGVSQEEQSAAVALFQEGNEYYEKGLFLKAAELYRRALKRWDHPAIHYNLSLSLMDTGLKLELREHLEGATRYGEAPLGQKLFEHASKLRAFIEKQLVRVEVSCDVPDASVTMDGQALFTAPGHFEGWVQPGSHTFVVTKDGHLSNERTRTPREGETFRLHISELYDDGTLTRYHRKWPAWRPWAMFGAGVAVAAGGVALNLQGRNDIHDYETRAQECGLTGCQRTPELVNLNKRGIRLQRAAVITAATGGAVAVTGAVLAFINRTQPYRLTPDEYEQERQVALHVDQTGAELLMTVRF